MSTSNLAQAITATGPIQQRADAAGVRLHNFPSPSWLNDRGATIAWGGRPNHTSTKHIDAWVFKCDGDNDNYNDDHDDDDNCIDNVNLYDGDDDVVLLLYLHSTRLYGMHQVTRHDKK